MKPGDPARLVNLFNWEVNAYSLAFGKIWVTSAGNNRFNVLSNKFDFEYRSEASSARNVATFAGGAVFGQFYTTPVHPFSILRDMEGFGGSFQINFIGTLTIPK